VLPDQALGKVKQHRRSHHDNLGKKILSSQIFYEPIFRNLLLLYARGTRAFPAGFPAIPKPSPRGRKRYVLSRNGGPY
jgi:hypothetical protein